MNSPEGRRVFCCAFPAVLCLLVIFLVVAFQLDNFLMVTTNEMPPNNVIGHAQGYLLCGNGIWILGAAVILYFAYALSIFIREEYERERWDREHPDDRTPGDQSAGSP